MRQITFILTIILFASCGQRAKGLINQTNVLVIDTLIAGRYVLSFENADSFPNTDIYGDLAHRKKLTDTIGNWHDRAVKIQSYLAKEFGDKFFTTDTTLVLILSNGKKESFPLWDVKNDEGYNFEHYFDNIDYYLLQVQFGEGNGWMLVNRKNGFKKYINGLPYISNDRKTIISINSDLEAGYSFNGIESYTILSDSLHTDFSKETTWGPTDVKWVNKNQFLIKREHLNYDSLTHKLDYKLVTIKIKTSQ